MCVLSVSLHACVECIHTCMLTCVQVHMHWRSAVDVWCLSLVLCTSLLGWGLLLNSKFTDLGGWRQSDHLRDLLCLPPKFSVSGLPFMWVPRIQTLLLHLHSKDFILGNHPHGSIFRLRWAHKSRWNETREGGKLKALRKEVGEKNQVHKQLNVRFRSVRRRLMLLKLQSETWKKNSKNENGKEKNRRDCRKHAMHRRQTKETHEKVGALWKKT